MSVTGSFMIGKPPPSMINSSGGFGSSALGDEWPLPGSETSLTAFRRRSRREVGRITTITGQMMFSSSLAVFRPYTFRWPLSSASLPHQGATVSFSTAPILAIA